MIVAQLVRASDCGSEGRGFETHHSPQISTFSIENVLFYFISKESQYIQIALFDILFFLYQFRKKYIIAAGICIIRIKNRYFYFQLPQQ